MCIRDRPNRGRVGRTQGVPGPHEGLGREERLRARHELHRSCLLYTSDAADERSSVDLGGRRIIKKKTNEHIARRARV